MSLLGFAGAALGAAGSLFSSSKNRSASKKAAQAAEFNPWGGNMPFGGGIEFDRANNSFSVNASEQDQALANLLSNQAQQNLQGGGYGGMLAGQLEQQLSGQIPGLFNQSQFAAGQLPTGLTNQFMQGSFGREQMANQLGGGFLGQAAGINAGGMNPFAQQAINQGFSGFNTQGPGSFQDVYQDRLGLLREQAQPFEQRQFNNLQQNLFDTGQMAGTGGGLQTEAFARGLGQADTARQLDAMGFSEGLRAQGMQETLAQRQQGLGMLGQGFNFQNAQNQFGLGQQQVLGGLGTNLLQNAQNFAGSGFGAGTALNDLQNQRAMQRLGAAQQLFGFGNQQNLQNINTGLAMQGAQQSMQDQYRNFLATGGNLGGAQASAGANAGRFMVQGAQNNMGDFFSGLGGGLFDAAINRIPTTDTTTTPNWRPQDGMTGPGGG